MNGQCGPCSNWPCGEPPYRPNEWNSTVFSHNCYAYMLNDLMKNDRLSGKSQPGWYAKLKRELVNYNGIQKLNCMETIRGVMKDNPDNMKAYTLQRGSRLVPPAYHYKGFLMVSPNQDFHFARQDNRMVRVYNALIRNGVNSMDDANFLRQLLVYSKRIMPEIYQYIPKRAKTLKSKLRFLYKNSKTWSHKPGSTPVSDRDADGNLIFDPLKANWDFTRRGGVNYSKNCCFFVIPMNTYKPTYSHGSSNIFSFGNNGSDLNKKARIDISTTDRHQKVDARVRKLLGIR